MHPAADRPGRGVDRTVTDLAVMDVTLKGMKRPEMAVPGVSIVDSTAATGVPLGSLRGRGPSPDAGTERNGGREAAQPAFRRGGSPDPEQFFRCFRVEADGADPAADQGRL